MFGQIQSKLFPMYFMCSLVLSSITLATYTARHPYETWTETDMRQIKILTICVVSTFVSTAFIAPKIVSAMVNVFELEKASGTAFVVGYADRTELVKDPKYNKYYKSFRIYHGIAGLLNIVTLVCNGMYLYHLACLCVYLNLDRSYCDNI
jgi:Trk-type K+ transport system membrane component